MQGRELLTIDGKPAAEVYNQWLDGALQPQLDGGGVILAQTALHPLAVKVGQVHGLSHYLLVHPESVTPGRTLRTFCDLRVGDRLQAMRGDRSRLVFRAGRVAAQARAALPAGQTVAGALIVYCGGCRMAVGEEVQAVVQALRQRLGRCPSGLLHLRRAGLAAGPQCARQPDGGRRGLRGRGAGAMTGPTAICRAPRPCARCCRACSAATRRSRPAARRPSACWTRWNPC
jgi:hypothetical protein